MVTKGGEPEPTVYWQKIDGTILPNDNHYDINSSGQLSIQNVKYQDKGTCSDPKETRTWIGFFWIPYRKSLDSSESSEILNL